MGDKTGEKISSTLRSSIFAASFRVINGHDYLTATSEQDWNKGFSDVPTLRRQRRDGP